MTLMEQGIELEKCKAAMERSGTYATDPLLYRAVCSQLCKINAVIIGSADPDHS